MAMEKFDRNDPESMKRMRQFFSPSHRSIKVFARPCRCAG